MPNSDAQVFRESWWMQLSRWDLFAFLGIALIQFFVFQSYVQREVLGDVILYGDPTWFTFFSYEIFSHMINHDWGWLIMKAKTMPWGVLLWVESCGLQLIFGYGRLSILCLNLIYYIACQAASFCFFSWFTKSKFLGWVGLLLFLTLATPFSVEALNIRDFHPDLITAFLFVVFFFLLGRSDCFLNRRVSIMIGLCAAYTSYIRLVSAFSLVGMLGLFFLAVIAAVFFDAKGRDHHKIRLINIVIATTLFLLLVGPHLAFSREAVKNHYFNFIFDKSFAAVRIPLYNYGLTDAFSGCKWIFQRVLWSDFGMTSLVSFGLLLIVSFFNSIFAPKTQLDARNSRHQFLLFYVFLVIAAAYTCYQHAVFPIKSANLTRLTMTPLFVLFACVLVNSLLSFQYRGRWAKGLLIVGMTILSLQVQLNFYASKSRHYDCKMDLNAISRMYEDLFSYCQKYGLKELGISTDFSTDEQQNSGYALGALMGFYSYVWEKHGILIEPRPQLGSAHDTPFSLQEAFDFLDRSDVVLLSAEPYPEKSQWPLYSSVRSIRPELVAKVKRDFGLIQTYTFFGESKLLYVRLSPVKQWGITASASTSAFYGPQWLLTEPRIWHAPWDGGRTPQWVVFTAPKPMRLSKLTMVAQDKASDRAPKSFLFQALDENGKWITLLDVSDANFNSSSNRKVWPLEMKESFRSFRLLITKNNGNPSLLTIQIMSLE